MSATVPDDSAMPLLLVWDGGPRLGTSGTAQVWSGRASE